MKRYIFFLILSMELLSADAQSIGQSLLKAFADGMNEAVQTAPYDRSVIRNNISSWNSCQNGTLSCNNGAIAYYGNNGYSCSMSVPKSLSSKMREVHDAGGTFNDVNITDGGYYILLWNDTQWYGYLPQGLLDKLRSIPTGTIFRSITFNDEGDYVIVATNMIYTSSTDLSNFVKTKKENLGILYSATIWQNGVVFCFEKGPTFFGAVPSNVVQAMNTCEQTPQFVKFNHRGDYLICSSTGYCSYNIVDVDKSQNAILTSNYEQVPASNNSAPKTYYYPSSPVVTTPTPKDNQAGLRSSIATIENSLASSRQRLANQIARGDSPASIRSTESLIQQQESSLAQMRVLLK